jgi:zinc protease
LDGADRGRFSNPTSLSPSLPVHPSSGRRRSQWALLAGVALAMAACGGEAPPPAAPAGPVAVAVTTPPPAPPDPLGPRPIPPASPAYVPPKATVFTTKTGLTVWLLERHTLPYVALTLTVPSGASLAPPVHPGLALVTADMLDEGAGSRGAIELSRAIDALGANLETTANSDESRVSLSVLKKNLAPAFAIFSDVIARPRWEAAEWKRLHDIIVGELTERQSEPNEVARVVIRSVLFGATHPYGHPVDGTLASAKAWTLEGAQKLYKTQWRPDRATLVAVGDTTQAELTQLLDKNLATWTAPPKTPAPPPITPPPPTGPWPKLVLVDRPDAPQSVVAVVRPGMAASDPTEPAAQRANIALGGVFTSRLNQDLREERGISYGASSRLGVNRGVGSFVAMASVVTDKTTDALKALLGDVDAYAKNGMTDAEVDKTRSQSRADVVESFERIDKIASDLATDAALGLGPDYEAMAAQQKDAAQKPALDALARDHFDPSRAVVVVVGPRAQLEGPLGALGYKDFEVRDAEGNLPKPPPAPKKPTP